MKKVFVDTNVILDFLMKRAGDFEDALQYYSAKSTGADFIVTRNIKDFPFADIDVLLPCDLIEALL